MLNIKAVFLLPPFWYCWAKTNKTSPDATGLKSEDERSFK